MSLHCSMVTRVFCKNHIRGSIPISNKNFQLIFIFDLIVRCLGDKQCLLYSRNGSKYFEKNLYSLKYLNAKRE